MIMKFDLDQTKTNRTMQKTIKLIEAWLHTSTRQIIIFADFNSFLLVLSRALDVADCSIYLVLPESMKIIANNEKNVSNCFLVEQNLFALKERPRTNQRTIH